MFSDIRLEDDLGNSGTGNIEVKESLSTKQTSKLVFKTAGRIYFRLELGYGFGDIPTEVELEGNFTYEVNGVLQESRGTQTEISPFQELVKTV